MRALSFLLLICLGGILACRNEIREEASVELETYSYENLDYPKGDLEIPDSIQSEFQQNFFLPWRVNPVELLDSLVTFPGKDLSYLDKYLEDDEWYGENKKNHKKWQREEIVSNVDKSSFPNFLKRGITVAHTDLRRIPTSRPGFDVVSKAGEGYPFDYFQETALWANTPLLILHISNDRQWCYAISPYYKGWVAMHDVAIVNDDFVEQWYSGSYCQPLSDSVNLHNPLSNYAINAKLGMFLPYEEIADKPNKISVYYANADENQNAKILKAEVDKSKVAFNNFEFNGESLKQLISNLIGRPYGWGGNLENRDCSSMIRDMLGTYRIWLPRDSKDQIAIGHKYEFPETAEEKIKLIKEKGVPFLTILRKKGHNMLYVGDAPNGEPLILHAIWGLKTSYSNAQLEAFLNRYPIEGIHKDAEGKLLGRHIIGEAVITSVTAGSGMDEVINPLVDEMYAMTNILEN
ncbi:MAG: SH3 domain-containing protein [Bacteroidota bacterium]